MFLNFEDFIDYCDDISSDQAEWVILYEQAKIVSQEKKDDVFIMSAMVEDSEENRLKLFERINWGFSTESFGKSTFYQYGNTNDNIFFKSGRTYEDFGLEYEYLVALRYFHGDYPMSVEINPELIWYGNLVKTDKGYLDSITDEVKIIHENNKITIHRDYLKDFFAAKNMIGVIVFDNRRFINSEVEINLEKSEKRDSKLMYYVHKAIDDFTDYKYYSSIIGKIIIDAYQKPLHEDYRYFFQDEEEYVEFIIAVNQESGELIRYTCNDDYLSNFFGKNLGSPHFLTPVFFSKDVLDRYTGNSAQYRVEDDHIVYLNIWSLPFTINKDGNVSVWLGDLGNIPNKEQRYWSVYNIRPKGEVNRKFIERQLESKWNSSILDEKMLFELIGKVNVSTEKHYGGVLFKKLSDGDSQLKSAFIKPSNNSIVQYQNFLMQLNKLTIERINTKMLSKNVDPLKLKQENDKPFGSRIQLAIFLKEIGFNNYQEMDALFKLISKSRNKLAGHSASIPQYNKIWGRSEDERLDTKKDSDYLLSELNKNLEALIKRLENKL